MNIAPFCLSVRCVGGVKHFLLLLAWAGCGIVINGSQKIFPNIWSLINHLSIMKENLACRLVINNDEQSDNSDIEENEDIVDIDSEPDMEEVVMQLKKFLSVQ